MVIDFTDNQMNVMGDEIQTILKPIDMVKLGKNEINFQLGKDYDNIPIYLLDKGVRQVVDYVGGTKLTFQGEKAVVYGFLKETNSGNGKINMTMCPFAVVKVKNQDKPQYLSMFGELTDKPTKEGDLFYQYMNNQISLDEIPLEYFKNQKFKDAVSYEEEGRLILQRLEEAEKTGKEFDMNKVIEEMDEAQKEFNNKILSKEYEEQE